MDKKITITLGEAIFGITVMYGLALGNIAQSIHNYRIMTTTSKLEKELDETLDLALKLAAMGDYSKSDELAENIKFLQIKRAERKIKDKDRPKGYEEE